MAEIAGYILIIYSTLNGQYKHVHVCLVCCSCYMQLYTRKLYHNVILPIYKHCDTIAFSPYRCFLYISFMWTHAHQNHEILITHFSKTCEDFGMNRFYVLFYHELYILENFHDHRKHTCRVIKYHFFISCRVKILLIQLTDNDSTNQKQH